MVMKRPLQYDHPFTIQKGRKNNVDILPHFYSRIAKLKIIHNQLSGKELHTPGHGNCPAFIAQKPAFHSGFQILSFINSRRKLMIMAGNLIQIGRAHV